MNDLVKNILLWIVIIAVIMAVFENFNGSGTSDGEVVYSDFLNMVDNHEVEEVTFVGREIVGKRTNGNRFRTYSPETSNTALIGELRTKEVVIKGNEPEGRGFMAQLFISSFPILLLIGVWVYFMRQMQGGRGGGGAMSFGKSKAKMLTEDQVKVRFNDVAGCEEAKEEVVELVDFLRDPGKFQRLGGKIPRGVLMVGPPGTGKTLLARAIAGEAKVPFFSISGSDFVEMFVGVGASRVRDMFEQAKKHAPCIIFIDEIDAVGRHRGAGMGGGHDEREQTLNQLLVEMDGFEGNEGVIVMAATNRKDVLDPALLRPGRFDRHVYVSLPDLRGREQILKVHLQKVPAAKDVDARVLARGTSGFSGAQLANLINEGALFAARANKRMVDMEDLERARDKLIMGKERRSMIMKDEEKEMTAYHEAGHTLVAKLVPGYDPIYKVSIIPRGGALGVTMTLPEEDTLSYNEEWLNSFVSMAFGGRIAEELIYGKDKVSTGASNDIQQASNIARNMVTRWGFSDKLGPILYDDEESQPFLGRQSTNNPKMISEETANLIDQEVRAIIDRNYARARQLMEDNIDKLHALTQALLKYETIDSQQVDAIMAGEEPGEPSDWWDDADAAESKEAKVESEKVEAEDESDSDSDSSDDEGNTLH